MDAFESFKDTAIYIHGPRRSTINGTEGKEPVFIITEAGTGKTLVTLPLGDDEDEFWETIGDWVRGQQTAYRRAAAAYGEQQLDVALRARGLAKRGTP